MVSSKFKLLQAPLRDGKRTSTEVAPSIETRPAKLPRATDIVVADSQRAQTQPPRNLPENAPCDVCIYRCTDQASDLWDIFHGKDDVPLYQIQLNHQAKRSMTYQMRENFNDYLATAKDEDGAMPTNLAQLETAAGVKLVVADRADPEGVGFQQWRVAFYCTDALNFLRLLDGWFIYKQNQAGRATPVQVAIHPYIGVDLSGLGAELSYEHYSINEPSMQLPLHIFDAQPVMGKKITVLNLQVQGDREMDLVITGHTWPFRARLDAFGVSGGYADGDGGGARRYYRVWKGIDVTGEDAKRFMEMLRTVFRNAALRITLDVAPADNTDVAAFIDELRATPSLFFVPPTRATAVAAVAATAEA